MNYVLKHRSALDQVTDSNQIGGSSGTYRSMFIGEHLRVLLFHARSVFMLSMLPAVFYRVNSLKKAEKLRGLIEGSITNTLGLTKVNNGKNFITIV